MDINHLKQKFVDEAENLLTSLDNALVELEKDYDNKQLIGEVFRVMHTIKGASGMFGFEKIVEITHELESLYDLVREGVSGVDASLIDISFASADHIRALLVDETFQDEINIQQHYALKNNIDAYKITNNVASAVNNNKTRPIENRDTLVTWHVLFYPSDEIVDRAINLVYTFHDLFLLGDYKINSQPFQDGNEQCWSIFLVTDKEYDQLEEALLFIMDYCRIIKIADYNLFDPIEFEKRKERFKVERSILDVCLESNLNESTKINSLPVNLPIRETAQMASVKYKTSHVNVDASKLDVLMYLVSELVTTKSELLIALNKENISKALDSGEKIEKLSKLFSENALNLRLVSIHEMTEKFKRLIRDLAKQLGKKINFTTIGSDTELDKSIIDQISEPIMHLIRNCIDHGVEMPEVRKSRGKSEFGTIKFETVKSGNYVYVFISDDGNGIDTDYIYRKAVEKGFINAATQLSEKEILDLIFLPGFSTAQSLSNVSGRGVGMDIVLKKIQEIRGEISIISNKGSGTTFTIKLQQTISIIDTLLISATGVTYAIPLDDVDSCILEAQDNLLDKQNQLINFNGSLIPYMFIEKPSIFGKNANDIFSKLIVIKKHDKTFALVVDNILGEFQAVIKPIGSAFNDVKFLSGASLLGDGSIALLIDTEKLWYLIPEITY